MRLLVIEDEVAMAAGLRNGLEAEGFHVDVADDGVAGLSLARERSYDLIVLDLMLPRMSGESVCRQLRNADDWTPVLVLTARDDVLDEVTMLDLGADDFLTKPFSFAVLVARLRSLRRRAGKERRPILQVGDLRLDPAAHRVWRGSNEVPLTARELALLEFLLQRPGDIVSKDQILEHVWGEGFEGDPNIIEVYIARLRNKLDRPFDRKTLHTVRGVGYRISSGDE